MLSDTGKNNQVIAEDGVACRNLTFRGSNNILRVFGKPDLSLLDVEFDCNDGLLEIGDSAIKGRFRIGDQCKVVVGNGVTTTGGVFITTAERCTVSIGDDCMFAAGIIIRAEDGHPIFDIHTGKRTNMPTDVTLGEHVWVGERAYILHGAKMGNGSIIGANSVVTGTFPNNCIVVGNPARMVRKDIAWERPHLTLEAPFYKPDASYVEKSKYWAETKDQA